MESKDCEARDQRPKKPKRWRLSDSALIWEQTMKPRAEQYVWVRMGDGNDYQKFDDVAGATDSMKECGLKGPLQWGLRGKLIALGFEGSNFISCFCGDKDGNYLRDLNVYEEQAVEKEI